MSVGRFCTHEVMTVHPAALVRTMERMQFHRVRRLVVVNHAQEVVGIITLDDILELLAEERQALDAVGGVMRSVRREQL